MKTVEQACTLRAGTFHSTRRDTVFDLSEPIDGRIDPDESFPEDHITERMKTLLTEVGDAW